MMDFLAGAFYAAICLAFGIWVGFIGYAVVHFVVKFW